MTHHPSFWRHGVVLVLIFYCTGSAYAQPGIKFVGEVIIVGNTTVLDSTIREVMPLYPGAVLELENVQRAEQALLELDLFVVDEEQGIRPTVTVLDATGPFKDIVISVVENPPGDRRWFRTAVAAGCLSGGLLIILATFLIMKWWSGPDR